MVKLCPICQKIQIADNYSQCVACLNKTKELNSKDDIRKTLLEIQDILLKSNWNYGISSLTDRLRLMAEVAEKVGDKELIKEIYESLKETYKKDLKNLRGIKNEQEGGR